MNLLDTIMKGRFSEDREQVAGGQGVVISGAHFEALAQLKIMETNCKIV